MPIKKLIEIIEMDNHKLLDMLIIAAPITYLDAWILSPDFKQADITTRIFICIGIANIFCLAVRTFFTCIAALTDRRMPGNIPMLIPLVISSAILIMDMRLRNKGSFVFTTLLLYFCLFTIFVRSLIWVATPSPDDKSIIEVPKDIEEQSPE